MAEFRDVDKRYGVSTAVSNLSLRVDRGEIFGLVGPDGAGKTTALELLCGLRHPTGGEIRVLGHDPAAGTEALSSRLGYLSQDFSLYGSLTVEENLDFFAEIHLVPAALREERKKRLLDFSRLGPFLRRRAGHLSGGMQKKLALCCALVHEPELLVLDEPTTGVDPVSRRELWRIIFGFMRTGITVAVTTPYMDEAEQCHRVALLDGGALLACGTPDELRATVDGELLLVRARPLRDTERICRRLPGLLDATGFGDRLHLRVPSRDAFVPELRQALGDAGVEVEEVRPIAPTMEDVFLAYTARSTPARDRPEGPSATGSDGAAVDIDAAFGAPAPRDADDAVVHVQGLVRRFGDFVAVDGIGVSVRRGEIFGFLGPNGAGKTTTIRMLCGLLAPSEGAVRVAGVDVVADPQGIRPHIGYMSQHFSLYGDLTGRENLELYGGLYAVPRRELARRIGWVVAMAGLQGREGLLARDLSGGWRQRLALGASLLHDPQVLFLDEPTSGVDPSSRKHFWELIYRLAERGTTVFVTTHYMDEAEHCHRLALVYRGKIIAANSPRGLRRDMRAGEMLEVDCDRPLRALEVAESEPYVWQASLFGKAVHVLVDDAAADAERLAAALAGEGVEATRLGKVATSLEDLFVTFIAMQDRAVERIPHA